MFTRLRQAIIGCAIISVFVVASYLLQAHSDVGQKLLGGIDRLRYKDNPNSHGTANESDFYDWHTRSQFRPVKQDVKSKDVQQLCNTFPKHLLRDIQPVLKTGHAVLEKRVEPQLRSVSACLDSQLLIVSDVDEDFKGYETIDVISDLRTDFLHDNEQLRDYALQKELADNGTLLPGNSANVKGWELDKFKFLPQVSRAWRMRPEKRWYVFYEADTYIVWDNLFRLLSNFDPDMPWYFGSPSPGVPGTWMANGGPGYVLSREAVRRLVKDDFDQRGVFAGSKLSERWEGSMMSDCCGDSVLGWALLKDAGTNVSGLWPMFQPHPLHGIPFSDLYWCQPVITMHKTTTEDMIGLRWWEESRRDTQRPLLFADLVDYLGLTKIAKRDDWLNSDWDGYPAPTNYSDAHSSFDACGQACKTDPNCFQWTYHLQSCQFTRSFRLGQAKSAEIEEWRSDEERSKPWSHSDQRFTAGWDVDGIKRWMDGTGRGCQTVQWVKPSIERIF